MAFSNQPLSTRSPSRGNSITLFGSVAFLGGFFFYMLYLMPVLDTRNWTPTHCSIASSQVGQRQGSNGPTYSVDIAFNYTVGDHECQSRQYSETGVSSSRRDEVQAVVDRYPTGKQTVCYVDPSDPTDAVLDRGIQSGLLLGLIPMSVMVAGIAGLVWTLRRGKQSSGVDGRLRPVIPAAGAAGKRVKEDRGDSAPETATFDTPVALAPVVTSGRRVMINSLVLLAAVGFLVGFIMQPSPASKGGDSGNPIVIVLFGVFTIISLVSTIKAFMRLVNPRIHVRVAPGTVRLGRDFSLEWEAQGGGRRLSRLCIAIQCQEELDFQNIRSINVDTAVCYHADAVDTRQADALASGKLTMRLPRGAMHSFNGGRNRIAWKISVTGTVPGGADVKDEYPLMVLPDGWEGAL
jgi:hypothetical protein